jgi:hypothetical protein
VVGDRPRPPVPAPSRVWSPTGPGSSRQRRVARRAGRFRHAAVRRSRGPAAASADDRLVAAAEHVAGVTESSAEVAPGQATWPGAGGLDVALREACHQFTQAAATGRPPLGDHRRCGGPRADRRSFRLRLPRAADLLRLGDQQVADLAAEDDADDVQVLQLERDGLPRPQTGHLPRRDHQPVLGQTPLELRSLPDPIVRGGQPQVPPHRTSPSSRFVARFIPATQASSTRVCWTCNGDVGYWNRLNTSGDQALRSGSGR